MTNLSIRMKRLIGFVAAFICILGTLLAGVFLGFDLSNKLQQDTSSPSRFIDKAQRGYGAVFLQEKPKVISVSTNRLDLELTEFYVPLDLKNGAGGIAPDAFGGLLIVDLEGKVFRFLGERAEPLDVETPSANVGALKRQLDAGDLGPISINFGHFRYNDIEVLDLSGQHFLLISYTEWHPERMCFTSTLAKAAVPSDDPRAWHLRAEDWTIVHRTRPCLAPFKSGFGIRGAEAGGRITPKAGAEVYWTSGAYNQDDDFDKATPESSVAQSDATDYGKVLLVDLESHAVRPVAKGLRNPQGIDVDPRGRLFVSDHGMRGGDELNLVTGGENFGFPLVTLGTKYSKAPGGSQPFHTGHAGFDKPIVAFVPSIAPSSVLYLRDFHPDWDGDVLVGGLKRQLHRVYMEEGAVLYVEPLDLGYKIRDLDAMGDGRIVLFTADKKLVFIRPASDPHVAEKFQTLIAGEPDLELRRATHDTFTACLECHGMAENEAGAGPSLYGVCGSEPERAAFAGYSGSLSKSIERWDKESLVRFVSAPEATSPGTTMAWGGIGTPKVAELLVETLCELEAVP